MRSSFSCVFVLRIGVAFAFALSTSAVQADLTDAQEPIADSGLGAYAELVQETELRRRVNVLYPNPQSIFDGFQVGYVSVRHGNLTFRRRDLVAGTNPLAKFARVYDSRTLRGRDFGPGWRLSLDEKLTARDDRLVYSDGSGAQHVFLSTRHGERDADTELGMSEQIQSGAEGEQPAPSSFLASGRYTAYPVSPQHAFTSIELAGPLAVLRNGTETRVFERVAGTTRVGNTYRLTQIGSGDGKFLALSYRNGVIRIVSDADGPLFEVIRDGQGRIVSVQDRWGRSVHYVYDAIGRLSEVLDMAGNHWRYEYSQYGRLLRAIGPNDREILRIGYDDAGRVTESNSGRQYQFTYTSGETVVVEGIGHSHLFGQNTAGITDRFESTTGDWWQLSMDGRNRVTHARSQNGNYEYSYGPRGELKSVVAASTQSVIAREFQYDDKGRIVSAYSQDGQHVRVEYAGGLTRINGPEGLFAFDLAPSGRIASLWKENTNISADYDAEANLVALVSNDRSVQFGRGPMGRVSFIRYSNGEENHYSYDELGNRASVRPKSGGAVRYTHDAAGNIIEVVVTEQDGERKRQFVDIGDMNRVEKLTYEGLGAMGITYDEMGRAVDFDTGYDTISVNYEGPSRIGSIVSRATGAVWRPNDNPAREQDYVRVSDAKLEVIQQDSLGISHPDYGIVRFDDVRFAMGSYDPMELGIPALREARFLYSVAEPMFSSKEFDAILDFEKPSNPVFQPMEYRSTNCCICLITNPKLKSVPRAQDDSTVICFCSVGCSVPAYNKPSLFYPSPTYQDFIPERDTEPELWEDGGDLGVSRVLPDTSTLKCKQVCDGQYQLTGGITVNRDEDETFIKVANYAKAPDCIKSLRLASYQDYVEAHERKHVDRFIATIDTFNGRFGGTFGSLGDCNTERRTQLRRFGIFYRFVAGNEESHLFFRGEKIVAVGCPAYGASSVEFFCGEDDRFICDQDTY